MDKKLVYLSLLREEEFLHSRIYKKIAEHEKDTKTKSLLNSLSVLEEKHAYLWDKLLHKYKAKKPKLSAFKEGFFVFVFLAIKKIFGIAVMIKAIEYRERQTHAKIINTTSLFSFTEEETSTIKNIESERASIEKPLEDSPIKHSATLNNIRDITFGMNDGLVEVLAAIVGLGAAIESPLIVVIGGLIVATAGTLSMAGGAYLSTDYEKGINKMQNKLYKSPGVSAFYVGLSYIFGAIFPLLPFILGYSSVYAIIISLVLTSLVLSFVAATIAVLTDTSIKRRLVTTLLISLGAAALTILLGYFARTYFHLNV